MKTIAADLKKRPTDADAQLRAARWYEDHGRSSEAIAHYQRAAANRAASTEQRKTATHGASKLQRIEQWRRDLLAEQLDAIRADLRTADPGVIVAALVGSPISDKDRHDLVAHLLDAQIDLDRLNSLVYLALAAHEPDLALAAANHVVSDRRDAQRLDTLAECQHVLGHVNDALATEDEAISRGTGGSIDATLRENRTRFAPGSDDAPEVLQLRMRAEALWRQVERADQVPDRASAPTTGPTQAAYATRTATLAFFAAQRRVTTQLETACSPAKGPPSEAVVRFDLTADGHPTKIAVLLDDPAPKKLRECINRELAPVTLPAPPPHWPARTSLNLHFS